jgi:hypothetical protein
MSAPYSNGSPTPTSAAIPPAAPPYFVEGQYLAKNKLSADERVGLANGILDGEVGVTDLCVSQVAKLCRVSVYRVHRARNGNGNGNGRHKTETLAEHILRSTTAERLEAARAIGIDAVWDDMIAPVVSEDRATN